MVALLQKVLQLYACQQLSQPQAGSAAGTGGAGDALLDELLAADESLWTRLIRQRASEGGARCACMPGGRACCAGMLLPPLYSAWRMGAALRRSAASCTPLHCAHNARHTALAHCARPPCCSEPAFMEALQRRMESVVLGLPSGSYAQRVQVRAAGCMLFRTGWSGRGAGLRVPRTPARRRASRRRCRRCRCPLCPAPAVLISLPCPALPCPALFVLPGRPST